MCDESDNPSNGWRAPEIDDKRCSRMIDDLSGDELQTLENITSVEQLTVELISEWEDDHCPCVGVKINGIVLSFWWLTSEAAAAFYYLDSPKARQTVFEVLRDAIVNLNESRDTE